MAPVMHHKRTTGVTVRCHFPINIGHKYKGYCYRIEACTKQINVRTDRLGEFIMSSDIGCIAKVSYCYLLSRSCGHFGIPIFGDARKQISEVE